MIEDDEAREMLGAAVVQMIRDLRAEQAAADKKLYDQIHAGLEAKYGKDPEGDKP